MEFNTGCNVEIAYGRELDPVVICHPIPITYDEREVINVNLNGKIFSVERGKLYDFLDIIWHTMKMISNQYDLMEKEV